MLSIHDPPGIERLRAKTKLDPHRLRQMRKVFYKKQGTRQAALAELPAEPRAVFEREVEFHGLSLETRLDSRLDGATKLLFRARDGLLIESVVLRMTSGRTALCVSTQVGCAADCDFCATGKMGLSRNLSAAEILDQLIQANQLLTDEGRSVRNLVFMGMGEPFHNEQQLYAALAVLADPACFNLNLKRVLVSTVGIPPAMLRCAERFPDVRMAVSLHSARDEVRQKLIPIAKRHALAELHAALEQVTAIQKHEVMIEYLLLAGLNDAPQDAAALIDYLRGLDVHINLIPYNPIADVPHLKAATLQERQRFSEALKKAGFPVTTRYSLGADILAACGQLVRRENRKNATRRPVQAASES